MDARKPKVSGAAADMMASVRRRKNNDNENRACFPEILRECSTDFLLVLAL